MWAEEGDRCDPRENDGNATYIVRGESLLAKGAGEEATHNHRKPSQRRDQRERRQREHHWVKEEPVEEQEAKTDAPSPAPKQRQADLKICGLLHE